MEEHKILIQHFPVDSSTQKNNLDKNSKNKLEVGT